MGRFIVRRLISTVVVLFAISVLTFLIFEAIRHTWGFDKPIYDQYLLTMKNVFTGKVISYTQQVNVEDQIAKGLPATLSLAIGAGIIWLALGTVLGLIGAARAGGFTDRALTGVAMIGVSTPVFLLGALLLYGLAYKLSLFPNGGYVSLSDPGQWLYHMILPWLALSALFIGLYSRVLRSNILDTINEDYVRTARAKGLTETRVLIRHVLRNSLIPIVALWGLDFAAVIGGGAILTESVFNLHGVGQYAAQSIGQLDVPPVLVIVMFGSFFVVLMSAVTDVLIALLDPRIKLAG